MRNDNKGRGSANDPDHLATKTHPTVSPQEWQAARDALLAEEKELTRLATSSPASDVSFPGCRSREGVPPRHGRR